MPSTTTVLRRSQPSSTRAVARDLTEPAAAAAVRQPRPAALPAGHGLRRGLRRQPFVPARHLPAPGAVGFAVAAATWREGPGAPLLPAPSKLVRKGHTRETGFGGKFQDAPGPAFPPAALQPTRSLVIGRIPLAKSPG